MNLDRFSQIVAAYGARTEVWPIEERDAAVNFMDSNTEAQKLIQYELILDQQLDQFDPANSNLDALKSRIVATIVSEQRGQSNLLDRILAWVLPENPIQLWRPALAASCPLIIGIMIGMNIDMNMDVSQINTSESWDEEFCIMALTTDCVEFIDEQ